ncbi:hypothetical protein SDC9_151132 [bioreactor metagenome]|uniref:Uncharacterized protein n=1 Tax=bioreactor metagenome TaxID=1076179 RepID=A0A645EPZ7_9ZZZZ
MLGILADRLFFLLGQLPCKTGVDSRLLGDGLGGALVVSGEHDRADVEFLQFAYGLLGLLSQRIRNCNDSHHLLFSGYEQRGFALVGELGKLVFDLVA